MRKLLKVALTVAFFSLFTFLPVSTKLKLISNAHATSSPFSCQKPSFSGMLKGLNFCNPAVNVVESAKPQPPKPTLKKDSVQVPMHQSVAVFYSPTPTDQQPSPTITQIPQPTPSTSLDPNVIFNLINEHRAALGLPPFEKDQKLCDIAESRKAELTGEVATGNFHSGLYARNLPFWITEDMKYGSNEAGTVNWWLHSPVHRAAIEGNYKYSCGATLGNIAIELFTNWEAK